MIWISHATGNVFVRALLAALEAKREDYVFHTTLGVRDKRWWRDVIPNAMTCALERRTYDVPARKLRTRPLRELTRLVASGIGWNRLTAHEAGIASIDAVYQDLDRSIASRLGRASRARTPDVLYGYEDGSAASFEKASELGIKCCYELPIAYWETSQRLLREEAERLPEWEPTLIATRDSTAKLERKSAEIEFADAIICPSQFVQRSLPSEVRKKKPCIVAEFGSPVVPESSSHDRLRPSKNLRVLFAGGMTQRKGLADVFAAMRLLDRSDVDLVVMGTPVASMEFYRKQFASFHYEPPRSHTSFISLMRSCDVLVLPSIVEGRALVQQEAMACGLPIIITQNTGGEDLVMEGRTGFMVPIRAPERIAEKIAWFADHRDETAGMGRAARSHAASYTWENYSDKIVEVIHNCLKPHASATRGDS